MAQTQPTDALSPKHAYRTLSSRYYWSPEIFEKENPLSYTVTGIMPVTSVSLLRQVII